MSSKGLRVTQVRVSELFEYEHNAKLHPSEQIEQIAASIEEFGFNSPILAWHDAEGRAEIVAGHGRLMAARSLGMERVPVVFLDHMTDEQRRAYILVDNQLTMNSGFDIDILEDELLAIDGIDMSQFDLDIESIGDAEWFDRDIREGKSHEEGNDEYNEFVDKFEVKKTTDDCYTPDEVYEAVADWVAREYGVERSRFMRPFYPDGDYQRERYPRGCVVVDNPPFSILTEIIRFYLKHGVRFFLFAPALTLFSGRNLDVCRISANCEITYENGAKVNTSFITNLDDEYEIRTAPELREAVTRATESISEANPVHIKYEYPSYVVTSAMVGGWCECGIDFRVRKGSAQQIGALDAMKEYGKGVFGGGSCCPRRPRTTRRRPRTKPQRTSC